MPAFLLFAALTLAMTWPQARHLSSRVHDSDDPLLSVWRISWIAHTLPRSPRDLLNGNIFHPEQRTLAYSDAVLLQGAAAAPLIWSGVPPVAVYNALLLLSIALSGWAMWLYATHLTGSAWAGVLAGTVFAFVPFRFDHFMHLELQAAFFLPLALLGLERTLETRSRRAAALTAAAFAGQVFAGIYYAVFLATVLAVIIPVRIRALDRHARAQFARAMLPAFAVALVAIAPYLIAYLSNRATLGERQDSDVALYSATLANYLSATPENAVHGRWSAALGGYERHLFPGAIALALAAAGVAGPDRRRVTLLVAGAVGLMVSLGFNSPLYEPLRTILFPYRGLRVPARAAILVFLAVAGLAAYGFARLTRGRPRRTTALAAAALAAAMLIEYRHPLRAWLTIPADPPQVYRWLAAQPRSVVAEVPFAEPGRLDRIFDGLYMFNSIYHWQPLVNGYSGFFPRTAIELMEQTAGFPDDRSIEYLKGRGVDLIVVHGGFLGADRYGEVTTALLQRPDVEATVQFDEPYGSDMVFRVRR
jgi:hypothetical protein